MTHPMGDLMLSTMEKIREMVDVNSVVGDPITTPDGTTIIPISKINFGFASGGSDFKSKNGANDVCFGGGGGAGVSIIPVSFLIISGGDARMLPINEQASGTADRLVEMIPEILNKVSCFLDENKKSKMENPLDTEIVK